MVKAAQVGPRHLELAQRIYRRPAVGPCQTAGLGRDALGVPFAAAQAGLHRFLDAGQRVLAQQLQDPDIVAGAGRGAVALLQGLPQSRKGFGQLPTP